MTIIGTNAGVAIAAQASLGAPRNSTYASYAWLPVLESTIAIQQSEQDIPLEVGANSTLSGGAYKTGYFSAGRLSFLPRVEDVALHWLLSAFTSGNYSYWNRPTSPTGVYNYYGPANTGTYKFAASGITGNDFAAAGFTGMVSGPTNGKDPMNVSKYLTVKHLRPKNDGTTSAEIFEDMMPTGVELSVAPGAPVTMSVDLIGRAATWVDAATGAAFVPSSLPPTSQIPLGCVGTLQSPDANVDLSYATSIRLQLATATTGPGDTQPVFTYVPREYSIMGRQALITINMNLDAYTLYKAVLFGSASGTTWSPVVWTATQPFYFEARTPGSFAITSAGILAFFANVTTWAAAPIRTRAGQITGFTIVGTVKRNDSTNGAEWYFLTRNCATGGLGAWPSS